MGEHPKTIHKNIEMLAFSILEQFWKNMLVHGRSKKLAQTY